MGNYSYGADDHLDKSALQGLTIDEACWLGTFHQPVITPLFFVETLADLDKEIIKGRSPESIVGNIAGKTPPTGVINVHHKTICEAELIEGFPVHMDRRPMVAGARAKTGHKKCSFIKVSPEMDALNRWHAGKFLEVERQFARNWRVSLSGINLGAVYKDFKCSLRSLQEAKEKACPLAEHQKLELRMSPNRLGYYTETIFWIRMSESRKRFGDVDAYVMKNGIFIPRELKDSFDKITETIWLALLECENNKREHDLRRDRTDQRKLHENGKQLMRELEAQVHRRVWSEPLAGSSTRSENWICINVFFHIRTRQCYLDRTTSSGASSVLMEKAGP